MNRQASASGKIILSGEYAVVFGYPGIAVPSPIGMKAIYESSQEEDIKIEWKDAPQGWIDYLGLILKHCKELGAEHGGQLSIINQLPLGKGMGSSTALVIAVARCLFGDDCRDKALAIEDAVNSGHSGVDFSVIWEGAPVLFQKGKDTRKIELKNDLLRGAILIDTGTPNETTPELVAWVRERESELTPHLEIIGQCTERLAAGEELQAVMHDHHRAQVALGVVPEEIQKLIAEIEDAGGAGKVLGAGARTGGGGMVLALGIDEDFLSKQEFTYSSLAL